MNNKFFIYFLLTMTFSFFGYAEDISKKFPKGAGSKFALSTEGQTVDLTIYVAESGNDFVSMEYHFAVGGAIFGTQMWQQFKMEKKGSGLSVTEGFFKVNELKKPQRLEGKYLTGQSSLRIDDFLITKASELGKEFVKEEMVETPAGTVKAMKYKKVKDGQTLYYWISEEASPISLVKLESTDAKVKEKNYSLVLKSLVNNVAKTIDPKLAIKMNSEGRKLLDPPKQERSLSTH